MDKTKNSEKELTVNEVQISAIERFYELKNILRDSIVELEIDKKHREPQSYSKRVLQIELEEIEEDYGVKLTEEEVDYINYFSSELCWHHSGQAFIYGGFKMNNLWGALVENSQFWKIDFSLSVDTEVPVHLKRFEQLNWIDKQSWCDDWRYGCFIREKGKFPPNLAFFDKNWYTPLNMTLEAYIEAMFKSCGVCGWQYFYMDYDKEMPHLERAYEDMENAVTHLPRLFPQMDFSYHRKKLEELKRIKGL